MLLKCDNVTQNLLKLYLFAILYGSASTHSFSYIILSLLPTLPTTGTSLRWRHYLPRALASVHSICSLQSQNDCIQLIYCPWPSASDNLDTEAEYNSACNTKLQMLCFDIFQRNLLILWLQTISQPQLWLKVYTGDELFLKCCGLFYFGIRSNIWLTSSPLCF